MPRDGGGVMSWPAGTTVTTATTIESAPYNAFLADLLSDLNAARPITAGGTGATTVAGAKTALGFLGDLVDDTSPQLGGFLATNGNYKEMEKGSDIASADPLVIPTDGDIFDVTGTTGFNDMTVAANRHWILQFDGACLITVGAGITLNNAAGNYTTAAGDHVVCYSPAANTVIGWVIPANGMALVGSTEGQHTIFVKARDMVPRVTTAPATRNTVEIATSLIPLETMDFATDADDFAGFPIYLPKSWDAGTLVLEIEWSTDGSQTAGLDGVKWFASGGCYASNAQLRVALGTAAGPAAQDHSATADDIMYTAEFSITLANAAAERWAWIEVYRDVSDAGDDLDIDARLHSVRAHYTTNAGNDD